MRMDFDAPKPEIKVVHGKNINYQKVVDEVLHGIEEEGVPFRLRNWKKPIRWSLLSEELNYPILG